MFKTATILMMISEVVMAQFTVRLRFNNELTEPSPTALQGAPQYSTWRNGFMVGTDVESDLCSHVALFLSFDYQKRVFDKLGIRSDKPLRGGDGYVWRLGLGVKLFASPIGGTRIYAQAGFATNIQEYKDITYNRLEEIGFYSYYLAYATPNLSSIYNTLFYRGGIDIELFGPFGVSGSAVLIQDELGGYFGQASTGLFIKW